MRGTLPAALLLAGAVSILAGGARAQSSSCVTCHEGLEGPRGAKLVEGFSAGVHAAAGLSCHDCHGGNPDPSVAGDARAAKSGDFAANPYHGVPTRQEIPAFCGHCHSHPEYMKRYRRDLRTDQEQEYRTSRHGIALERGDPNVATCVDCHGVHGIQKTDEPDSPVHPTRVADTCGRCHSDATRMAGYETDAGDPLPVGQAELWRQSVHADALLRGGDYAAPTCNDCHGDHGATPPGIGSLVFVCGRCHAREASLFRQSGKKVGFENHEKMFLPSAGPLGCALCHPAPQPQAKVEMRHFAECETCHGNHLIVRPGLASLAPLPPFPCLFCHLERDPVDGEPPEPLAIREHYRKERDRLLQEAPDLSGEELFDWLLDRAVELPAHMLSAEGQSPVLKPAFAKLLERFRIRGTTYTYEDPATGETAEGRVVRCTDCHPVVAGEGKPGTGARVASGQIQWISELTSLVGRTERALLYARRRGVEVQDAATELDAAIDSLIAQHALLHEFRIDPDSDFAKKHAEGIEHARLASDGARVALEELEGRRRGLALSLVAIVLVLIGLALKIRSRPIGGSPSE